MALRFRGVVEGRLGGDPRDLRPPGGIDDGLEVVRRDRGPAPGASQGRSAAGSPMPAQQQQGAARRAPPACSRGRHEEPRQDVLGSLDVLAHQADRAGRSRRGEDSRRASGAARSSGSAPGRDGRSGRSGRSSLPAPRSSRSPGEASGRPRQSRCGSGCRRGGSPRSPRASDILSTRSSSRSRSGASARSHARSVAPASIATRWSSTDQAAVAEGLRSSCSASGGLLGDERAAAPAPLGDQVARTG